MKKIEVYHSHIEVSPYELGECQQIERQLSKYDKVTHSYIPMMYYIEDDVLYLPRGYSSNLLEKYFGTEPIPLHNYDDFSKIKKGEGMYPPKSEIQEKAIDFLCGEGDYKYSTRYGQLGLNLGTGEGKTYGAICSVLKLKIKAMIVTHQEKIKQQWIDTLKDKTTLPNDRIVNISGSDVIRKLMSGKLSGDIYLINHQTIQTYARTNGWKSIRKLFQKLKIGIKVIDESHKYFENIFMLDNFTNCYKTFYLTATFGRTDPMEVGLYNKAFSSLARFDDKTMEKRKHTHFVICYIQSRPADNKKMPSVNTLYGFSKYKYIDYEFKKSDMSMKKALFKILEDSRKLEGKTLILSPKKETVDIIADEIESKYTDETVGRLYSNNTTEENESSKEHRYISSTISSSGVGSDIKGLRVMIVLEPISSAILADQVQGRLREYSHDEDTYMFYIVDTSIPESYNTLKRVLPVMKKKCVDIITTKLIF